MASSVIVPLKKKIGFDIDISLNPKSGFFKIRCENRELVSQPLQIQYDGILVS